jgi:hypothetical protein
MSNSSLASDILERAAQYVWMSTEHQQYSIANQFDAIQRYPQRFHSENARRTNEAI